MTRRRRILLSAAVLAASVCIALGVLSLLPPRPGVTKANFDRIEVGMTLAEVEAILGEPHPVRIDQGLQWYGDRIEIYVEFAGRNTATRKVFAGSAETILDKLLRWLRISE